VTSPPPSSGRIWAVLLAGVAALSCSAILIRLADAPALSVAAWRLLMASAVLAPWVLRSPAPPPPTDGSPLRRAALLVGAGTALACHFAAWILSLDYTSVASAVVLGTTTPVWVALGSWLVLREPAPRAVVVGLAIASLGAAVVGWGDLRVGGDAALGDALALIGAVAAGIYLLVGRRVRPGLPLGHYLLWVYGSAALLLTAATAVMGLPLSGFDARTWLMLGLLALGPQLLGHSSLNWALRHLRAEVVASTILLEPLVATLLAWWILAEAPTWLKLVGGALVIAGVAVTQRTSRPPS
jgi:drug/metabolite transporter (DMT)-like permease